MADDGWIKSEQGDTWDFTANKEMVGLFIGKEENVGENNSNLYSFEVDQKNVAVWGSTVLDIRMKNVKVGEEVKIVFLGMEDSPNRKGKQYKNFDVFHREPSFESA